MSDSLEDSKIDNTKGIDIDNTEGIDIEKENDSENVSMEYDIVSYPSDHTLSGIAEMWETGDIEIPDYQREFVWSSLQSSLLIDSFLRGLPVPPVFFYIDDDNKNLVIDGQQRILSIVYFLEGYFGKESTHGKRKVFRLSGLGKGNKFEGKKFDDLDPSDKRKILRGVLRSINIKQMQPANDNTSAYHIFERLNTGGTPLKAQEIRNCVFRGEFINKLKEANKNPEWRKILGQANLNKFQKDVEFLLRVFSLFESVDSYEKPMKEFLNKAAKKHCNGNTDKVNRFFAAFPIVVDEILFQLGEKPFNLRGPLNVSALDSVMCVLFENYQKISSINLKKRYDSLKKDEKFIEYTSISTTDDKIVKARIDIVREFFLG